MGSWLSQIPDSRFCFLDLSRNPARAAKISKPATETPTPIPIFAPLDNPPFEADVWLGDTVTLALALGLGLTFVGVGVEVADAVLDDTGATGGDLLKRSRSLNLVQLYALEGSIIRQ